MNWRRSMWAAIGCWMTFISFIIAGVLVWAIYDILTR